jgi:hypothetical protein
MNSFLYTEQLTSFQTYESQKKVRKCKVGRDSSVGIATRYGMDSPKIESRLGRDFSQPSRPAMGPNQPPIQWVPGLFHGGKAAGGGVKNK